MSAFSKVSLNETDNMVEEKVVDETTNDSAVEEQVEKFDTSYTVEKLQKLYNEYDKITIDEDKIKELTMVKTNAVSNKVPFRQALVMTTGLIVMALLAFLCVYNIFVINGLETNINYLQEEVVTYQYELSESEGVYDKLTNVSNIQNELSTMGYESMSSSNVVAVSVPEKSEVASLQGQTNWFDSVCNFISRIFG